MQEFQQRVIDEKKELDEKRGKLSSFLTTDIFRHLPGTERERLLRQSYLMSQYSIVLGERIGAFV